MRIIIYMSLMNAPKSNNPNADPIKPTPSYFLLFKVADHGPGP